MFFWLPPSKGKCEWEELKSFVELFNEQFGTKYTLSSCLDQEDRTNPQPEILLEDKDQKPMVIERKSIEWPPAFIEYFYADDGFGSTFINLMNQKIKTGVFILEFKANSLKGSKKFINNDLPQQIAEEILKNWPVIESQGELSSNTPTFWRFRRLVNDEYDENIPQNGVGIRFYSPISFGVAKYTEELKDAQNTLKSYLGKVFKNVEKKFRNYSQCIKILVLEPYGDDLFLPDDFIDKVIQELGIPNFIDGIWLAEPEFVGEFEWQKSYRKLSCESRHVG